MNCKKIAAAFLLLALCVTSFARGPSAVAAPQSGGFKVAFASNGTPLASYTGVAGGVLGLAGVAALNITPSVVVQAAVTGAITGGAAGAAWGVAAVALGAVAIAGIQPIKDWMATAGARINTDNAYEVGSAPAHQTAGLYCSSGAGLPSGYTYYPTQAGAGGPNEVGYACGVDGNYSIGFNYVGRISADPTWVPSVVYGSATVADVRSKLQAAAPTQAAVQALYDLNFPPAVSAVSVAAPAPVFVGNTVKLNADGSTTSTTETASFTALGADIYINLRKDFKTVNAGKTAQTTSSQTTTNPDGSTSTGTVTAVTTTAPSTVTGTYSTPKPEVTVCGLPGTPACKIDETGTPDYNPAPMVLDKSKLDADASAQRDAIKSPGDKGMFSDWGGMFTLPTLTACEPLQLPVYSGYTLGTMDVCPGAEWLRSLMAFVWAVSGLAFCWSCVEGVI